MTSNDELFLEEIRNHPEVYDTSNLYYWSKARKEAIWKKIDSKFEIDAKKKWNNLRSRYCKEKQKMKQNKQCKKKWYLYPMLQFLDDFSKKSYGDPLKDNTGSPSELISIIKETTEICVDDNSIKQISKNITKNCEPRIEYEILDEKHTEEIHLSNKCGQIYLENDKFILICEFCQKTYDIFANYSNHVLMDHDLNKIQSLQGFKFDFINSTEIVAVLSTNVNEEANSEEKFFVGDEVDVSLTLNTKAVPIIKSETKNLITNNESQKINPLFTDHNLNNTENSLIFLGDSINSEEIVGVISSKEDEKSTYEKEISTVDDIFATTLNIYTEDPLTEPIIASEAKNLYTNIDINGLNLYHIRKSHQCIECNILFNTNFEFYKHNKSQHPNLNLKFTKIPYNKSIRHNCDQCNKSLSSKRMLRYHMNAHKNIRPYKCQSCNSSFTNPQYLKEHIRIHTGNKKHSCNYCDKKFFSSSTKKYHEKTVHEKIKSYQCEDCGETFPKNSILLNHKNRKHNPNYIRPKYECDICNITVSSNYGLKKHKFIHEGKKPYKCDICFARFNRQSNLVVHKKIHSDIKKYICNICGKKFAQSPGLYSHIKSHGINLFSKPKRN